MTGDDDHDNDHDNDRENSPGGDRPTDERSDEIHVGTRRVRKEGRVTIPKETRDRFSLTTGDSVDLRLLVPGKDEPVRCSDCLIVSHGQVIIPAEVRQAHGIQVGGYLDLTVSRHRGGGPS